MRGLFIYGMVLEGVLMTVDCPKCSESNLIDMKTRYCSRCGTAYPEEYLLQYDRYVKFRIRNCKQVLWIASSIIAVCLLLALVPGPIERMLSARYETEPLLLPGIVFPGIFVGTMYSFVGIFFEPQMPEKPKRTRINNKDQGIFEIDS